MICIEFHVDVYNNTRDQEWIYTPAWKTFEFGIFPTRLQKLRYLFFSILYLTSIEIIFTIYNFLYIALITFAIEAN